jgi:hypothetical protein
MNKGLAYAHYADAAREPRREEGISFKLYGLTEVRP